MKKILTIFLILGLVGAVCGKSLIQKLAGLTTAGISAWDLVYINENSTCAKADANIIKKACGIYMGISGEIWLFGKFINPNWTTATKPSWEAGESLFLSETAGAMDIDPPTSNGSIAQKVGYIVSIDAGEAIVYFEPSEVFVVIHTD